MYLSRPRSGPTKNCTNLVSGAGREVHERELGGVPQLVAEEAVALHAQDVQIQVAALRHGAQRESDTRNMHYFFVFY